MNDVRRTLPRGAAVALLAMMAVDSALAGQILLKNGDRISGAISKIWDGEVYIEPDYADEFTVDLDAVAYLESTESFEIELADGTEVVASLGGIDDDGNQVLIVDGAPLALGLSQVKELAEIEDYFEWDSRADVNATLNKGNTDSQNVRIDLGTELKVGDHRHALDLDFIREELDGVSTKEQDLYRYNYNWLFSEPWFLSGIASYEKDPIRLLDYRYILGAGLGLDIWDDADRAWSIQSGLGYQEEKIDFETSDNTIAFWVMKFNYDLFSGDLEFFHQDSIYTNLSGRRNTVFKTQTGVRIDITDDIYTNLRVDYDYETDPAGDADKEDLALVIGLGAEF